MPKLRFFDCNCSVGRVAYPHLYDIPDVEGLLKEMETAGIEEALVYHTVARDGHPPLGNSILMEEIKNIPELHPVWVMGHSGGPHGSYHAVELAKESENIFLDIALSTVPARQIEFFVSEIGSERVIFGTDNPYLDPRPQIGRVGLADISHLDRVNIFSANAHRMIDF